MPLLIISGKFEYYEKNYDDKVLIIESNLFYVQSKIIFLKKSLRPEVRNVLSCSVLEVIRLKEKSSLQFLSLYKFILLHYNEGTRKYP